MKKLLLAGLCAALCAPVVANANEAAIQARKGYMKMIVLNFGPLGAMVKGEAPYDAAVAQTSADNLLALSTVNIDFMFPEGVTSETFPDMTRTLPAIDANKADFIEKYNAFGQAVDGLAEAAGQGVDALKAAFGPVGKACGACHQDYRAKDN